MGTHFLCIDGVIGSQKMFYIARKESRLLASVVSLLVDDNLLKPVNRHTLPYTMILIILVLMTPSIYRTLYSTFM